MKIFTTILWVGLLLLPWSANRVAADSLSLPLSLTNAQWRPLEQRTDRGLQTKLERTLAQNQLWKSLIVEKKMTVGVVDLASPKMPRFAQVNGDTMLYAASIPKLLILLAACQGFENGTLKETPQIHEDLTEMIRLSSNPAANRMIDLIGLPKIESLVFLPRYRFYDLKQGGGLWLGGRYASYGDRNTEPLKDIIHAATANQVCRFYYLLAYGKLINPKRSRQMLTILSQPKLHDKFASVLEKTVPPDRLYRKSGTYNIWHSDSVLVWGGAGRRYILVSLVESDQGEQILRDLVPGVEQMLRPTRR
jgi:beta-lactamase class A